MIATSYNLTHAGSLPLVRCAAGISHPSHLLNARPDVVSRAGVFSYPTHVRKLLSGLRSRAGVAGLSTARRRWGACTALAVGFHPAPSERTAGESCPVDGATPSGCLGGGVVSGEGKK
jgi:hypothetical protein